MGETETEARARRSEEARERERASVSKALENRVVARWCVRVYVYITCTGVGE